MPLARSLVSLAAAAALAAGAAGSTPPVGYQGRLESDGRPVSGDVRMRFTLFDAPQGGRRVGDGVDLPAVPVRDGLFRAELPFGPLALRGTEHWLRVEVFDPQAGGFVALEPRQRLAAAPMALALPGTRTLGPDDGFSVLGGSPENTLIAGLRGVTVSGGGGSGGIRNAGFSDFVTVSGGANNHAGSVAVDGDYATVGGGLGNFAIARHSVVSGGFDNIAQGAGATIGGGEGNFTDAPQSVISGGLNNCADAPRSTVAGGENNAAEGEEAAVGGGFDNTASGVAAMVPGGERNTAAGRARLAAGFRARAAHDGTFVWSDRSGGEFTSAAPNTFLVRAAGGIGINESTLRGKVHLRHGRLEGSQRWSVIIVNDGAPGWVTGMRNSNEGFFDVTNAVDGGSGFARLNSFGVWNTVSDARLKADVRPMEDGLDAAMRLRPVSFEYRSAPGERRIGFVAQEVREVLPSLVTEGDVLTMDYATLSTVAIAAIQEQQREIERLRRETERQARLLEEALRRLDGAASQSAASPSPSENRRQSQYVNPEAEQAAAGPQSAGMPTWAAAATPSHPPTTKPTSTPPSVVARQPSGR